MTEGESVFEMTNEGWNQNFTLFSIIPRQEMVQDARVKTKERHFIFVAKY